MKNVETKQLPTKMYYGDSAWSRDWRKWWHELCYKLGLSYDTSPPNRAERRKSKRKKR